MITIPQIVDALTTNRTEFGNLFLRAQGYLSQTERVQFEVICKGEADDKAAFTIALNYASAKGFLQNFSRLAADAHLENGDIASAIVTDLASAGNADLQAMTNAAAGYTLPNIKAYGIISATKWTGKVMINGAPKGSGVLIGPNLFLTAWHVVKDLFDPSDPAGGSFLFTPKKYAPPAKCPLTIKFDDLLGLSGGTLSPMQFKMVDAHQDWYFSHSTCHEDEDKGIVPDPTTNLNGFWDYTIIRLSKPCGYERRWAELNATSVVPPKDANIILFEYPKGVDLKIDENHIRYPNPNNPAIPDIRFLHSVNSDGGASGGPCFDKEFSLIGIHQGAWPNKIGLDTVNRGIPITNIIGHIPGGITNLPKPDPKDCPLWETYKGLVAIGCDNFISRIWDMALMANTKLLNIRGLEKTGKTFLMDVAYTLLPDTDHLKISLSAEDFAKLKPVDLAKRICDGAGAVIPEFTTFENYNTSAAAWLRDELVAKTISAIDTKRSNRKAWILITNLNAFNIEDANSSDLLFLLYEQLASIDWLRVVLDGAKIIFPDPVKPLAAFYTTSQMAQADIENFLDRFLSDVKYAGGSSVAGVLNVTSQLAGFLYDEYKEKCDEGATDALSSLAKQSSKMVLKFLQQN